MELIDPEKVRLQPGQSFERFFCPGPESKAEVGFFLRSAFGAIRGNGDLGIQQRGGVIRFNEVLLVLTMLKLDRPSEEFFDIWWNFHTQDGPEHFQRMSEQDKLVLHFYGDSGQTFRLELGNGFQRFFAPLPALIGKMRRWTEVEFDRALRSFCAQAYPKENLWDMIQFDSVGEQKSKAPHTIDDYEGTIPIDLHPFYIYLDQEGHCIRVIPSMMEDDALSGDPEEYLLPAPIKTVLRCGIRWIKGFPVAAVPYIPGYGLAVPPEDREF
jgi:hypothetical protein